MKSMARGTRQAKPVVWSVVLLGVLTLALSSSADSEATKIFLSSKPDWQYGSELGGVSGWR